MKSENWIKWDLDSRKDLETRWFLNQFTNKAEAYGIFLYLVEELYNASPEHELPNENIFLDTASHELGVSKELLNEAIAKLIEAKLFFASGDHGDRFGSYKVKSEVVKRHKLSETRSEVGRIGGEKSSIKRGGSNQLPSKRKQTQAKSTTGEERRGDQIRSEEIIQGGEEASLPTAARDSILAEFGVEVWEYYNGVCNDYILASGKTYKNLAAFMRNWIRKDMAERKGFFYPKDKPGFVPHTGASAYETNLELAKQRRLKNGQKFTREMFDTPIDYQEELESISGSSRDVELLPSGDIKPRRP